MSDTLSKEQLLLLNNLMYATDNAPLININGSYSNHKTIGEFVEAIYSNLQTDQNANGYSSFLTKDDWSHILTAVRNDQQLMNLEIIARHTDPDGGGQSVALADPSRNEAVVIFKGTATPEWKDNFRGGYQTDTAYQQNAKAWFDSLDLDGYDSVTVTGHSKGGNKAKYITVLSNEVDRCVSFDGQGFSDEFMEKYKEHISVRQGLIENHNAEKDYVNLLLNDIGETHFYKGNGDPIFFNNHAPDTMMTFDANGKPVMTECQRPESIAELDKFLNNYIRSMPSDMKASSMELVGDMVQTYFSGGNMQDMANILLAPGNEDEAAYLIGYALKYDKIVGLSDDVLELLDSSFGLRIISKGVLEFFQNPLVAAGLSLVDNMPDFMYGLISDLFAKLGVTLTASQCKRLAMILGGAFEQYLQIQVDPSKGEDVSVPFSGVDSSLNGLISAADGLLKFLAIGPGIIFVQPAQLILAASKMLSALQQYRASVKLAQAAAEDLASKWQGDARNAFVQEQSRSCSWLNTLGNIVSNIAEAVNSAAKKYIECDNVVRSTIRGHR